MKRRLLPAALLCLLLIASGCDLRQRMYDQPKYEPHEATTFFADGLTARRAPEGTMARGQLRHDDHFWKGKVDGEFATTLPSSVTLDREFLERGRERFDIFCSPCHDRTGQGNGMVVRRGLKKPPSLHEQRLRDAAIGYYFDVQTNGFGAMFSYASRVPAPDRWAIAAYIRTLQLSQRVEYDQLPAEDQRQLP